MSLTATSFSYESNKFRAPDGSLVTDDDPIRAIFQYTQSPAIQQSDPIGGTGGLYFNDITSLPLNGKVERIDIRGGARLDAVAITMASGQSFSHGGNGGSSGSLTLRPTEHLVSAKICQQNILLPSYRIYFASFQTDMGNSISAGRETDHCVAFDAQPGWQISVVAGRSGVEIDQLSFIYTPIQ